jgi:hypothetical protein
METKITMALNLVNQLGEWNPQLFREIKGRLTPRNTLIAVVISLLGQLLLLMSFTNHLPVAPPIGDNYSPIYNRYCTGNPRYLGDVDYLCVRIADDSFGINWQMWWQDVFVWLSIFGLFALLVGGTYMLVNDLSKEEHRGTLNFLRLAPQSSRSILIGKLMGVPILLYLLGLLALPLHLAVGLSSQIPLHLILGFYTVLGASWLFFYSGALLFGLVGSWLGSFQAWLGSGAVLMFLFHMTNLIYEHRPIVHHAPTDWMTLFAPLTVLPYLSTKALMAAESAQTYGVENLQWFYLPVGLSVWSTFGLMLLNYGLWTYWVWQGLARCFHNPSVTLLGKQQSYWLTACFEVVILGFALNPKLGTWRGFPRDTFDNFGMLLVFNLLLFLYLIAALSPQRQAIQDWARYRHQKRSLAKGGVMSDLLWGEKSPALVAVVMNVAIASAMILPWILLWPESQYKTPALWGLLLNMSLICVYAAIAQLMLLMKTPKRLPFAAATVGLLVVIPPILFSLLSREPFKNQDLWLFSAFPWMAREHTTQLAVFLAVVSQSLVLGLLSIQLTRQLHKAGESSTKALLSGRPPVAID